jgi:hypothetical protein
LWHIAEFLSSRKAAGAKTPAFTFFSIKIPLKVVCSEEKKLPQGRRSRKGKKNEALYRNLFDFEVKKFFNVLAAFQGLESKCRSPAASGANFDGKPLG